MLSYKYRGPRTERSNVGTILISAVSLPNEFAMTVSVPSNQQSSPYLSLHPRAVPRSAEPEGPGPAPIDAVPVSFPLSLAGVSRTTDRASLRRPD